MKKEGMTCHHIEGVVSMSLIIKSLPPGVLGFGFFLRWSFRLQLLQKHYMDCTTSLPRFYPHLTWWVLLGVRILGMVDSKHTHTQFPSCSSPCIVSALVVPWVKCSRKTPRVPGASGNLSMRLWEIICQVRKRRPHLSLWKSPGGTVWEIRHSMPMTDRQCRLQSRCLNESSIPLNIYWARIQMLGPRYTNTKKGHRPCLCGDTVYYNKDKQHLLSKQWLSEFRCLLWYWCSPWSFASS